MNTNYYGFDKYDYKNWYDNEYKFTCPELNVDFYTTQYEYNELGKKKISDYSREVKISKNNPKNESGVKSYFTKFFYMSST